MHEDHRLAKEWEKHGGFIRRLLVQMTRDRDLAEDLAQDTYLRAHAAFEGFRGGEIRAWLAAIAKNVFYAYARRKFFSSEVLLNGEELTAGAEKHPPLELDIAVGRLTPKLQSPFLLRHRDGFTYDEIARMLEVPVGTVKSRVSHASRRLRAELGEEAVHMNKQLSGKQLLSYLYGPGVAGPTDSIEMDLVRPAGEIMQEAVTSSDDPRLSVSISYKAVHKPVMDVIADLADLSGVALKAGHDNRDWQVRSRRMNILVEGVPLGDLMNSIARVMVFQWSKTSDAEPTYRLYANQRAIAERQAEWRVNSQELRRQVAAGRSRFLDVVAEVAVMSESEAEKLKDHNFHLYFLWKTGTAQLTTAVFKDVVGLREAFTERSWNLSIPISLLSPATKKLMLLTMRAFYYHWHKRDEVYPAELEQHLDEGHFGFELVPRPFTRSDRDQLVNFRGMGCGIRGHFFHLGYYYDSDLPMGNVISRHRWLAVEEGMDEDAAYETLREEFTQARLSPLETATERLLPLDPRIEPEEKVEVDRPVASDWERLIPAIAEATGLGVVSDSFHHSFMLFDRDYNRQRQGGILEFRSRDWFKYRASQIPEEWIGKWRKRFEETGAMTLDEFSQFGVLTYEQIEENVLHDPVLGKSIEREDWNLMSTKAILRLYAALDTRRREQLFSDQGLDLNQVPPDLWQLVMYEFQYNNVWSWNVETVLDRAQEGIRLVGGMKGDSACEFRCIVGKESPETFTWRLSLPKSA